MVTGTVGAHSHDQNRKMLEYKSEYEEEISKLTEIITTPKSEIDRKVRNALLIFEIQTSVTDERLRLVLLTTCMESLLLGKSDRDYLRWRLAEKSAFLFPSNRETIYEKVKEAYDKRSGFVHGSGEKVTKEYTNLIETTVISILKRLVKFKEEGYETMEKVDSYIQKLKFREP